jgi:hypothetical protein
MRCLLLMVVNNMLTETHRRLLDGNFLELFTGR